MKFLKIGIIGCRFGAHLARELAADPEAPFKIKTVCDMDFKRASTLAEELGVKAEEDYRKLLKDNDLDAIGLYVGPAGRANFIHEIINAGKDVMTTKPFETDVVKAQWILREARKLGRVIHLNSPGPKISRDLLAIQDWANTYKLGRPCYFLGSMHADYHEQADGGWYDDPTRCPCPPIFRLGIYLINDLQTLWGKATALRLLETRLRTGRPTSDNAVLSMEFSNGVTGAVAASFCVHDGDWYRNSLQLSYEKGTIYKNFGPNRELSDKGCELQLIQEINGHRELIQEIQIPGDTHHYDWQSFAQAIIDHEPASQEYETRIVNGIKLVEMLSKEVMPLSENPALNEKPAANKPKRKEHATVA
jgi:predicted dehydrogenase